MNIIRCLLITDEKLRNGDCKSVSLPFAKQKNKNNYHFTTTCGKRLNINMIIFYDNQHKCHKTSLKYHSGAMLRHLKSIAIELLELCFDKVRAIFLKVRAMLLKIKTKVYGKRNKIILFKQRRTQNKGRISR